MILVDTSVWIKFFKDAGSAPDLPERLSQNEVVTHPWVIGELMMGLRGGGRRRVLNDLAALKQLPVSSFPELAAFVERERLYGSGLSFIDSELLYSALVEGVSLWTHDRRLKKSAARYHCAW